MKRPVRPSSLDEFLKLSPEEKKLWLAIDKAEARLMAIAEVCPPGDHAHE